MANPLKILLVEDDVNLAQLIAILLSDKLEAAVTIRDNGWKGLDIATQQSFDLIILDVMLPGMNGMEICKKIRQLRPDQAIMMLTAKAEEPDKIEGFECGADDYLTKPFSHGELIARIKSLIRRFHVEHKSERTKHLRLGELSMDLDQRILCKNDHPVEVTAKEFDLISFFMKNPGRAFTRQQLLDEVWGPHFDGLEHTVNSTINRLRSKIENDLNHPQYILTAWGVGYKFRNN